MEAEKIKQIIKEHITWTLAEDGKTMCCYFTNHSSIIFQADSIEDATQKGLDILHSWIEFTREMMSNGVDFLEVDEKTFLGKQPPVSVMPSEELTKVIFPYIEDADEPHSCCMGQRFSYCFVPTKEIKMP